MGDRVGRKSTLVALLRLMGASTTIIGLQPTYAEIAWLTPLLRRVLRFGMGGEWGGAAVSR